MVDFLLVSLVASKQDTRNSVSGCIPRCLSGVQAIQQDEGLAQKAVEELT